MALCWLVVMLGGSSAVAMVKVSRAASSSAAGVPSPLSSSVVLSASLEAFSVVGAAVVSPPFWEQPAISPTARDSASAGAKLHIPFLLIMLSPLFFLYKASAGKYQNLADAGYRFFTLLQSSPAGWARKLLLPGS